MEQNITASGSGNLMEESITLTTKNSVFVKRMFQHLQNTSFAGLSVNICHHPLLQTQVVLSMVFRGKQYSLMKMEFEKSMYLTCHSINGITVVSEYNSIPLVSLTHVYCKMLQVFFAKEKSKAYSVYLLASDMSKYHFIHILKLKFKFLMQSWLLQERMIRQEKRKNV